MTYLVYMVDIMAADGLATQGARASATMILKVQSSKSFIVTQQYIYK